MTNLETRPDEMVCDEAAQRSSPELLIPRDVPLGGPRAMTVRRTLPQRRRSLIGSWCFLDHYGPDRVAGSGGMRVARHPHTGLATVTWLFTGEIDHVDSMGTIARVRPGEANLMIGGRGVSHQEFSTPDTTVLHGVQLWYALPDATRHMAPVFEHHAPQPVHRTGAELRVFIGSLAGSTSPVDTRTLPLLGAEILLEPGARLDLALEPAFEHGVLVDSGEVRMDGTVVASDHLAYRPPGADAMVLEAGSAPVRLILIGGVPLGEQIVMWWNFIGRSHDEVVAYRAAWQAEIGAEPAPAGGHDVDDGHDVDGGQGGQNADDGTSSYPDGAPFPRFGPYPDGQPDPLPAPALPRVQLRMRG